MRGFAANEIRYHIPLPRKHNSRHKICPRGTGVDIIYIKYTATKIMQKKSIAKTSFLYLY